MAILFTESHNKMTTLEFLKQIKHLPTSVERPCTRPSNAELKRWIRNGSVIFNSEKCQVEEEIDFPIFSLIFFPKGKRKTTMR